MFKGFKPFHITADKALVIEALVDDFVDNGKVESIVGAGADHHEPAGFGCGYVGPDINDREFASLFHGIHEVVDLLNINGFKYVSELEHHMLCVFKVVGDGFSAHAGQGERCMLDISGTGRVVVVVIGGTKAFKKGPVHVPERPAPVGK